MLCYTNSNGFGKLVTPQWMGICYHSKHTYSGSSGAFFKLWKIFLALILQADLIIGLLLIKYVHNGPFNDINILNIPRLNLCWLQNMPCVLFLESLKIDLFWYFFPSTFPAWPEQGTINTLIILMGDLWSRPALGSWRKLFEFHLGLFFLF